MDYDSHMRAAMQDSGLYNVVSYDEGQVGSMMLPITAAQAAEFVHHCNQPQHAPHHPVCHQHHHHNPQESPHQQQHNEQRQQLNILHCNSVSAASQIPSSFANYNAAIVKPHLQSALLQATHAFNQSHHVETDPPIISAFARIEPSTVIVPTEEEKPDVGAPKALQGAQVVGGRDRSFVITTSPPTLLLSPTMHEIRAAVGMVSMEMGFLHSSVEDTDPIRAKILSHPAYPRLVEAYVNCHKIGAPAGAVTSLDEVIKEYQTFRSSSPALLGADPELDHFMETYCNVLQKYHDELMQPYKEAMAFFRKIELQFNALHKGTLRLFQSGDEKGQANANNGHYNNTGGASVEEEMVEEWDVSCDRVEFHDETVDPLAEDQKLKAQLLRKYSRYIFSLKQEFLKKKKKEKLPKDARQKLLDWWSQHYKWPYPSRTATCNQLWSPLLTTLIQRWSSLCSC